MRRYNNTNSVTDIYAGSSPVALTIPALMLHLSCPVIHNVKADSCHKMSPHSYGPWPWML